MPASSDANRGLGDDFDDFEEGAEAGADDDFGDFDEGFEETAFVQDAHSAAQPVAQEVPMPSFVSSYDLILPYDEIYTCFGMLSRIHAYTVPASH